MGARPNDLEVIPLTFDVIVTRSVSLVMQMCLFCFSSCTESPSPPPLVGGHPGRKQDQAPYWSSIWDLSACANS